MAEHKKILIIDDDKSFVESNKDLLEAYGYTVFTAFNGESGFVAAKKMHPDLIILDVMMTYDTEGFDVARKIKADTELGAKVKVLLVSGITKAMKLESKFSLDKAWLPVDRVLEKPIDPARLMEEIQNTLEQ